MKNIAVIGLGRFGAALATGLFEHGHEVLAIDGDMNMVQRYADSVTKAICVDPKDQTALKSLGLEEFDSVVVAFAGDLGDSVIVTMNLVELGCREIICKAKDLQHEKILLKLGASKVIIPEREMGKRLAVTLGSANVIDYVSMFDGYGVYEVNVPKPWIGRTVLDLEIRKTYGINIIGIRRNGKTQMSVDVNSAFETGDELIIIASEDKLKKFENIK